jgi:hypothetical protein
VERRERGGRVPWSSKTSKDIGWWRARFEENSKASQARLELKKHHRRRNGLEERSWRKEKKVEGVCGW